MSTPIPLQSNSPSPQHTPSQHVSPIPQTPPLNLPLSLNVVAQQGIREPPHYSSLINTRVCVDKLNSVVEEVIAEGGFGVIFLVKNSGDKCKYALKRVVVNSLRDYEGVLGEIAVMTLLSPKTPHLLRSLSHVIMHYPASTYEIQNLMPLCKQNLLQVASHRIQKSQFFEATEILQILTHVSTGLQYLHAASPPIIHRDIKIENVLLLDDNYVLSDFGSATVRIWDPLVDSINSIQEDLDKNTTLQYRSPEMVDLYGGRGPIGCNSDIWALGVCGFKLMSFKDPFESILAIQNRNLNWSSTKGRYTENLVLLIETLLAEHQTVRPNVQEVIKMTTSALSSDWTPLQAAYTRVAEDKKSREEASVKKQTTPANIVMETTVTPRQRPKRNVGNAPSGTGAAAAATTTGVIIPPVLAAPPKSPKPVSPSNAAAVVGGVVVSSTEHNQTRFFSPVATSGSTISPTTQPQQSTTTPSPTPQTNQTQTPSSWTSSSQQTQPLSGGSYNPFDDDYRAPSCDTDSTQGADPIPLQNDDSEFDVFANAPFDYFKYQPIIPGTGQDPQQSSPPEAYHQYHHVPYTNYAPNNPFLYPEQDYSHSYDMTNGLTTGVVNLSFDEHAANNVTSTDS